MIIEALAVMLERAYDGMTIICVTHETAFAKTAADRVIFINAAKVIEQNDPNAFFNNPQHERRQLFLS